MLFAHDSGTQYDMEPDPISRDLAEEITKAIEVWSAEGRERGLPSNHQASRISTRSASIESTMTDFSRRNRFVPL